MLRVDTQQLTSGLAQARAAFEQMGGAAATSGQALRQVAAFDREVEMETAKLTALLAGQSKAAADVAARYTQLRPAEQAHLIALKEQVAAQSAVEVATQKVTVSLQQFGAAAQSVGRNLTAELTGPIVALGGFALKSSLDVAHAFDTIRQQTGATGAQLAGLEGSFRRLATQVPQDFGQVAQAVALVAQRTHLSGAALETLTKQELNLARVTGTDLAQNVRQTTRLFEQWNVSLKEQGPALDQLFRAHQQTGAGLDQLENSLLRFGPALKEMGLSLTDSEALLGTFEKTGVNTDRAMQGLNMVFAKWAKAGITDAHTAMANLITQIQKAPTAFEALRIATEAGFSGRGGADFVNAVRTSGFAFDQLIQKIRGGGDTINKAAADTLHFSDQFKILQKAVELALAPLGDLIGARLGSLANSLKDATPRLRAFAEEFRHQSQANQDAEFRLGLFAVGIGPVILGLGKLITAMSAARVAFTGGWAAIEAAGEKFFAILTSQAAASAAALTALQVGAIAALALFATAYLTNFHGLRDDLVRGFETMWQEIDSGAAAFWQGFQELGHSSLSQIGQDFERGLQKLGEYWRAGVAALKGQTLPPGSLSTSGGGGDVFPEQGAAGLRKGPPRVPAFTAPPAPTFGGGGAVPSLKAESAATQELTRFDAELAGAKERLGVLMAGESNIAGQVAARFKDVSAATRAQLVAVLEHIRAIEKHNQALEAHKKHLEEVAAAQKAALPREINAFIDEQTAKQFALSGATAHTMSAAEALAKAYQLEQRAVAANNVEQTIAAEKGIALAQANLAAEGAIRRKAAALKIAQGAEEQEAAAVKQVLTGLSALTAKHDEVRGTTVEEVDALKVYGDSLKTIPGLLQNFALAQIAVAQNDQDFLARQKELNREFDSTARAWTQAARLEDAEIERKAQLTGSSRALAQVQTELTKALADGNDDLALYLLSISDAVKANDALAAAQKADAAAAHQAESAFRKTSDFMSSEFDKAFKQLASGKGAKDFFAGLLADLDQFLTDWAAKLAAAQLTTALFGTPGQPGRGGTVTGATTGLLGSLAGAIGGLFGGGASSAEDLSIAAFGLPGPDIGSLTGIPGMATGGDVFAGQPIVVGERGPESFVPQTAGTIFPTHSPVTEAVRGGSMTVNQHFTIQTPDVRGFQKSQSQILQSAHREADRQRKRSGF